MLFKIRLDLLQPERGNPRQINASLQFENADFLKSHLGTFMYYHFLRDFFEDISKFHRDGDIAFCKPGISDLCITWNVSGDESPGTIRRKIIDGLEYTGIKEKQKYWEKYSMTTSLNFVENKGINTDSNSFLVSVEGKFHHLQKTAVNAGWIPEV